MSNNAATIATAPAELIGPHPINTVEDMRDTAERAGSFYFSPDTMRFFSSRIMSDIFPTGLERGYFVTSERDTAGAAWDGARRYTVRRYFVTRNTNGAPWFDVDNVGEFGEHATRRGALRDARHYSKRERAGLNILTSSGYLYTAAA